VTRVVAIAGAGYPSAPGRPHRLRCPPMSRVAVVTDTTHYMPRALVEQLGLHEVSLYVTFDGVTEREADLTDLDDFYDRLSGSSEMPSTSQPSVGDFLAVYQPLLEAGGDIVSIHLSAGISGTYATAGQAREQLLEGGIAPERIVVLDSATACAGLGMMAIAATSAARAGAGAREAADAAQALRRELKVWFAVDTLEFLRRGGRIGGAQAWLGATLKIKPILSIESEILPIERVRTSGRAFERMVDHLASLREEGMDRFFLQHIQAFEQAERLAQRGEEIYGRPPEIVSEMGPVIGAHAGPGVIGVTALHDAVLGPI
jgi:DegV family protein with EDD domain